VVGGDSIAKMGTRKKREGKEKEVTILPIISDSKGSPGVLRPGVKEKKVSLWEMNKVIGERGEGRVSH